MGFVFTPSDRFSLYFCCRCLPSCMTITLPVPTCGIYVCLCLSTTGSVCLCMWYVCLQYPPASNRRIGAVIIVWRVRWKIIRSVPCSIVYSATVVQSAMHTHTNRPNSCLLVGFSFSVVTLCVTVYLC